MKLHLHLGVVDQGWLLGTAEWVGLDWIGLDVRPGQGQLLRGPEGAITIPTEIRRAPHSAGGVTSDYPSRRDAPSTGHADVVVELLEGAFGRTAEDGKETKRVGELLFRSPNNACMGAS